MDNIKLIENFYHCFQQLDSAGMARCYHPEVYFSDPVFNKLHGDSAIAMWQMLCSQAQSFELEIIDMNCDEQQGIAHWEARYIFSHTDREVHNLIESRFRFKDARIINHHDDFNFWKWSSMALGPTGLLLGWTPMLKRRIQNQAARNLSRFMKNRS